MGLDTLAAALDTTDDKEGAFEAIATKHQQNEDEQEVGIA